MRSILVLNSKGGSGKTTIASNLASFYAVQGKRVGLMDFDPQRSALDWLALRAESRPPIIGIDASEGNSRTPRDLDVLIMDAPARTSEAELSMLMKKAQTALIPVVPSVIDLNAAARFLETLKNASHVLNNKVRVASIANRVRERSHGRVELEEYLRAIKLPDGRKMPFTAVLRNSQNYIFAAERGLGVGEIAPSRARHDLELWEPLLKWLASKRSIPS